VKGRIYVRTPGILNDFLIGMVLRVYGARGLIVRQEEARELRARRCVLLWEGEGGSVMDGG
jgi:hypothetical protein